MINELCQYKRSTDMLFLFIFILCFLMQIVKPASMACGQHVPIARDIHTYIHTELQQLLQLCT